MASSTLDSTTTRCCPNCLETLVVIGRLSGCAKCGYTWSTPEQNTVTERMVEKTVEKTVTREEEPLRLPPTVVAEKRVACHIGGCTGVAQWRGLCSACYGAARTYMDREKLSWADLAALGLITSPFQAALEAALAKKSAEAARRAR